MSNFKKLITKSTKLDVDEMTELISPVLSRSKTYTPVRKDNVELSFAEDYINIIKAQHFVDEDTDDDDDIIEMAEKID